MEAAGEKGAPGGAGPAPFGGSGERAAPRAPRASSALADLAAALQKLDDLLARCMRCGFCQAVCPVYGETLREADVTRGKIALLRDLAFGLAKDPAQTDGRLRRCLLCSSCERACPSGARIMDIFVAARQASALYFGLGPAKRLIFRLILPRPRLFRLLARLASALQGPFLKPESPELATSSAPLMIPMLGRRHVPALPFTGFSDRHGGLFLEPAPGRPLALLFPGCAPDRLFPSTAEAALKALRHHGSGVWLPEGLVCCGMPLISSGDREGFLALVRENLRVMAQRRFGWLVTPCGSCASCVKEHWRRHREFFTGADLRMIDYLGENTCDICCYLTRVLKVPFPEAGAGAGDPAEAGKTEPEGALSPAPAPRVTYHDACHLRKSLGVWREPREILKSLPGWSYAEMPEAERCCGGGGSFTLEHGELSEKIGARKRKNILSVSPHTVAAACPACALQLTDTLSRGGDKVRVRHVIELYADTLPDEAGALGNGAGPKALGGGSGPEASGNESGPGASKNGPGAPGPAPKTV